MKRANKTGQGTGITYKLIDPPFENKSKKTLPLNYSTIYSTSKNYYTPGEEGKGHLEKDEMETKARNGKNSQN